ncbi:hypothetical protein ABKV19_019686 [Rosa sericea]
MSHFEKMGDPLLYSLALIVFALLLIKLFITNNRSQKYKNLPPSPPCLPIIGHLHLLRQPIHRTLESLSAKYGKIQLLRWGSRRVVLVSSPSIVEECFTKHDTAFSNRPLLLAGKHFHYNYTTVVVAPYGDLWRNLRRVMTLEIFSSSRMAMFSSIRQGEVRLLLDQISKSCGSGMTKVELKSKCIHLPFNVMTMMIVGKRYYGEDVGDAEEAKNFREAVTDAIELNSSANLGDFLPFLQWGDFSGLEKKMVSVMAKMDCFLQAMVSDRREILSSNCHQNKGGGGVRKLLIDNLLLLQQTEPELYTDEIIKGIILALLVVGTETDSTTLEWAMSLLLNHPDQLDQVKAEIDFKVGQGRLLDEQDLPNLNYLQNVINETLRLYPPIPLLGVREASEDCVVGGFDVPCGAMMVINAWAIHRDPELWNEPTKFKPERFEGWSGEGPQGYKLIPFGGGRRGCPGAGLANRFIGLVLGSLIQSFEWERISEEKVDMSEGLGLTMPKIKPLEALCKPRPLMQRL